VYCCGIALRFYRSPFIGLCLATALFWWFQRLNSLHDNSSMTGEAPSLLTVPGPAVRSDSAGDAAVDEADHKWRVKVMREMPPWMISPDVCKVNCINQLLSSLWPGLKSSIEAMLLRMIDSSLTKLPFVQAEVLSLGSAPPLILGLKHYPQTARGQNVMLDIDLLLAGDANVCIKLGYGKYFSTTVKLYDVYFKGRLRIELGDIGPAICPFSSLNFVLPQRPDIDFSVSVGALQLTSIPGLSRLVNSFILRELTGFLSPPYGVKVPLFEQNLEKPYSATALGVLRVHIKSAHDLWDTDFTSLSDPFCIIEVKEPPGTRALQQKRQTRHIMDDLNPIWDESFEFLVQSSAAVLTFTLYDWDEWGSYDMLGQAREVVIVEALDRDVKHRGHFELSGTKFGGPKGTLNADLEWKPFSQETSYHRPAPPPADLYDPSLSNDPIWSSGVILTNIIRINGLGSNRRAGTSTSNAALTGVTITVGILDDAKTTRKKDIAMDGQSDVEINWFLYLMVANLSQKLELRAVDSATGEQLGHLQQNVVSIVRSGGELSGTLQLSGSQNGSVELKMHFRHVSPHTHGQSGYTVRANTSNADAMRTATPDTVPPSPMRSVIAEATSESGLSGVAAALGMAYSGVRAARRQGRRSESGW